MAKALDLGAGPVRWDGAVGVEATGDGVQPWRLSPAERAFHHPALVAAARCPSGVRLRWRSDTRSVAVALEARELPGHEGYELPVHLDLVIDDDLVATRTTGLGRTRVVFDDLPPGPKDLELWLPTAPAVLVRAVEVDAGAHDEPPPPDTRLRWIVYGSSITQGSGLRPTRTWPALVARRLGWHLVNLGYTGQCHLDPLVARLIATLPADRITAELGINVHNFASLRERTFGPAVHGLLATVRDGHPNTPVTVLSPVVSPEREATARSVLVTPTWRREYEGDLTLAAMRTALQQVVDVCRASGDPALRYVDGLALLGPADAGLLPDGLHPNAAGHRVLAERYAAAEVAGASADFTADVTASITTGASADVTEATADGTTDGNAVATDVITDVTTDATADATDGVTGVTTDARADGSAGITDARAGGTGDVRAGGTGDSSADVTADVTADGSAGVTGDGSAEGGGALAVPTDNHRS